MKFSTIKKGLFDYMWLIIFVVVFLLGLGFIFWMGNTDVTSGIKDIEVVDPIDIDYSESPESTQIKIDLAMPEVKFNSSPEDIDVPKSPDHSEELDNDHNNNLCPTLLIKRGNKLMLFNKNLPETPGENPIFFNDLDQYKEYIKVQRELYNESCPILFLQEEQDAQGENVYKLRKTEGTSTNVDPLLLGSVNDYFKNTTNVMPKFQPPKGIDAFNKPTPNSAINMLNYSVPIIQPPQNPTHAPMVPYVDANRSNAPFNQGFYGFDPSNQYVGKFTILDEIHNSTKTQNPDGLSDNPMDPNWGGAVFTDEQIGSGKYDMNKVQPPTATPVLKYDDYPSAFDGNSIPMVENN